MHNDLDLFVFHHRGKSQHFEYAHAVVGECPCVSTTFFHIQKIIAQFFNIKKDSIIIPRVHQGQISPASRYTLLE